MLLRSDFNTHIYSELIAAIERDDDKLSKAISAAIKQAKGYLNRFDLDTLFGQTGSDRDEMLLMLLKDLASWHFVVIANPNIHIELIRLRYEDAKSDLEKIQKGMITPDGWPPAEPASSSSYFHITSQPRRNTSY